MRRAALLAVAWRGLLAPPSAAPAPGCLGEPATIVAEHFAVRGTPGDDVIVGGRRNVLVESRAGDDLICLDGEFAEVYAGAGDDRIAGSSGEDLLYPGAGDDTRRVRPRQRPDHRHRRRRRRLPRRGGRRPDPVLGAVLAPAEARCASTSRGGAPAGTGTIASAVSSGSRGPARPDLIRGDAADNHLDGIRGGDTIVGRRRCGHDLRRSPTGHRSRACRPLRRLRPRRCEAVRAPIGSSAAPAGTASRADRARTCSTAAGRARSPATVAMAAAGATSVAASRPPAAASRPGASRRASAARSPARPPRPCPRPGRDRCRGRPPRSAGRRGLPPRPWPAPPRSR